MPNATASRPRIGLVRRVQCARIGHYWASDGTGRHGVCVRCGKHLESASDASLHMQPVRPSEQTSPASTEWPARWTANTTVSEATQIGHDDPTQTHDTEFDARSAERHPVQRRSSLASLRSSPVMIAVVSLALVGGVSYLALRRRGSR